MANQEEKLSDSERIKKIREIVLDADLKSAKLKVLMDKRTSLEAEINNMRAEILAQHKEFKKIIG